MFSYELFKTNITLLWDDIMIGSERYIENHTLEFDIENSDCNECYQKHLECQYYYGECRRE